MSSESKEQGTPPNQSRRNLLKVAATASALLIVGGVGATVQSIISPETGLATKTVGFPRVKVANFADLKTNEPLTFNYPLDNEPNLLVKLGQPAEDGIGPNRDIVAFSQVCQHLGCIYSFQATGTSPSCNSSYKADRPVGYCCCHGSIFDLLNGARVISGPSPRPEPRIILEIDESNDIYAVGMTRPSVFGHCTGSDDVSCDLQGGTPVG